MSGVLLGPWGRIGIPDKSGVGVFFDVSGFVLMEVGSNIIDSLGNNSSTKAPACLCVMPKKIIMAIATPTKTNFTFFILVKFIIFILFTGFILQIC